MLFGSLRQVDVNTKAGTSCSGTKARLKYVADCKCRKCTGEVRPLCTIGIIFHACDRIVVLYGSETWAVGEADLA